MSIDPTVDRLLASASSPRAPLDLSESAPCPSCGQCLRDFGVPDIRNVVPARHDPEGKVRLEITVLCEECETEFYVFVAVSDLVAFQ